MNKETREQQDYNWACLPNETRAKIKEVYEHYRRQGTSPLTTYFADFFGEHNIMLNSDPVNMLVVEEQKIRKIYNAAKDILNHEAYGSNRYTSHLKVICLLEDLFKDQCNFDDMTNVPFLTKPKYSKGEKVIIEGRVDVIEDNSSRNGYILEDGGMRFYSESELKPYIEDEYELNKENNISDTEIGIAFRATNDSDKSNNIQQELDLYTLLEGYEGNQFYVLSHGYMKLKELAYDPDFYAYSIILTGKGEVNIYPSGKIIDSDDAVVILYPTKELYEKYPFDAYAAWMEWIETHPKKWRADYNEYYFYFSDDIEVNHTQDQRTAFDEWRHKVNNYFPTKKDAEEAANRVKDVLTKFNEEKYGK